MPAKKKKIKAKVEIIGGDLKWLDRKTLNQLQDLSSKVLSQTGAMAFFVREIPKEDVTADIFIDEPLNP